MGTNRRAAPTPTPTRSTAQRGKERADGGRLLERTKTKPPYFEASQAKRRRVYMDERPDVRKPPHGTHIAHDPRARPRRGADVDSMRNESREWNNLEWPQKNESNGRLSPQCLSGLRLRGTDKRNEGTENRNKGTDKRNKGTENRNKVLISGIRVPIIGIRVPIIGILSAYGSWHVGTSKPRAGRRRALHCLVERLAVQLFQDPPLHKPSCGGTHNDARTRARARAHARTHARTRTLARTHAHAHTRTHTHTHVHARTHARKHTQSWGNRKGCSKGYSKRYSKGYFNMVHLARQQCEEKDGRQRRQPYPARLCATEPHCTSVIRKYPLRDDQHP